MIVYLIDSRTPAIPRTTGLDGLMRRDESHAEGWRRIIRSHAGHADSVVEMVAPTDTFADLVLRVASRVANPWSIYLLRIMCHGSPGYLELGTGVGMDEARHFEGLAHYMTPARMRGQGVQIHGCEVAHGARGHRFLQRVANRVGMPVAGSDRIQYADRGFVWDGPPTVFEPRDGSALRRER
jgi:Domain of unknown function (DUF4347)